MQNIVLDKPYQFIPPLRTRFWPAVIRHYMPRFIRREYGVVGYDYRREDRLKTSLAAGHGILLAPNHCRMADPIVLGLACKEIGTNLFAMASWHLFARSRFEAFMIRRMGAFSVYREGLDRQAINTAVEMLAMAERPLVIFPEGAVSRHNDVLMSLMDGTAFIARTAAKRREKEVPGGKVLVHPVAIRYTFGGDLSATVEPVLTEIERRLSWEPQLETPLVDRLARIGEALLSLKEVEYFGRAQRGDLFVRVKRLIDHLLEPIEAQWGIGEKDREKHVIGRVKRLRTAILPEMVNGQIDERERERRWKQLRDCYLAQQLSLYPQDYVARGDNVPEHVLETVERFEEDLTDNARIHPPLHATIEFGEAIEVSPRRERGGEADSLMQAIEGQLTSMLAGLAAEAARNRPAAGDA